MFIKSIVKCLCEDRVIDINQIYKMLNWKNPLEVQLKGICLARDIKDLSFLIKPPADSSVWEQCAKILCEKSNGELEPYLEKLFEWIEDLNWPGASDIYERLKKFPSCKIHSIYSHNLQKAIQMEDYPWKFSLKLFSSEKPDLIQYLPKEQQTFLMETDKDE